MAFFAFYLGGMLAVSLVLWADGPILQVPKHCSVAKVMAAVVLLVLAWPIALVVVRLHWERETKEGRR